MTIAAIVAAAKNNVIGSHNQIPWHLPVDLQFFKRTTLNHHVIMGRNTFESIGKPLPKRTNVVISRDPFFTASGIVVVHSLHEALELAAANGETEAYIIGGGQIFEQAMPLLDKIYLTDVDLEVEGDVFFPKLEEDKWLEVWREEHLADEKNKWNFTFRMLEKKAG